jgi:F-type H+-transporting ATPase subunit alpha
MNTKKVITTKKITSGTIVRIQDNIITVFGLGSAFLGEIIVFNNETNFDIYATVAVIEDRNTVKLILVKGNQVELFQGVPAFRTYKVLQTLVGFGMLGKIITSLGDLVDDDDFADPKAVVLNDFFNIEFYNIFARSPSIIERETVAIPFFTGVSTIDCFTPIGCGQRQLIIGDFNTGKTSLALTMLLNQRYIMNTIDKV